MSILDGLALYDADGHEVPRSHKGLGCYFLSREVERALTNPTDEQIRGILARLRWADTDRTVADVRRVLAAAAGDDQ